MKATCSVKGKVGTSPVSILHPGRVVLCSLDCGQMEILVWDSSSPLWISILLLEWISLFHLLAGRGERYWTTLFVNGWNCGKVSISIRKAWYVDFPPFSASETLDLKVDSSFLTDCLTITGRSEWDVVALRSRFTYPSINYSTVAVAVWALDPTPPAAPSPSFVAIRLLKEEWVILRWITTDGPLVLWYNRKNVKRYIIIQCCHLKSIHIQSNEHVTFCPWSSPSNAFPW